MEYSDVFISYRRVDVEFVKQLDGALRQAGREVWRMAFPETTPAGGSSKNRRADRVLALEAGTYTVRFKTDDSHAWKDWNAEPPDDPLGWGVTVYRASRALSTR